MKKPRSKRSAPCTGESTPPPARVLLFPCLVQLANREAPRPAGGAATGEGRRFQLVLENAGPADAAQPRAGSGR